MVILNKLNRMKLEIYLCANLIPTLININIIVFCYSLGGIRINLYKIHTNDLLKTEKMVDNN